MSAVSTSRIHQLLYLVSPHLNFAQVVGDLHSALKSAQLAGPTLTWDCDDIALIDFESARVVVGFSDNLPGAYAACLTIAAGCLPQVRDAALTAVDQDLLCQAIADRLERRFPSDAQQNQSIEQALTPDLIDSVVDALFQENDAARPSAPLRERVNQTMPEPCLGSGDVDRLMSRLSMELVTRTPNLIARAIASATPRARAEGEAVPLASDGAGGMAKSTGSQRKSVFKNRLFWPKVAVGDAIAADVNGPAGTRRVVNGAIGELSAVRNALYAADEANRLGTGKLVGDRFAARSTRALQALVSLPGDLANGMAALRHNDSIGDRIRH